MHKCLDFSDKMDIIGVTPPGDTPTTHPYPTGISQRDANSSYK